MQRLLALRAAAILCAAAFSCCLFRPQDPAPPVPIDIGGSLRATVCADGVSHLTMADGTVLAAGNAGVPMFGPVPAPGGMVVTDGRDVFQDFHPEATASSQPFGNRLSATLVRAQKTATLTHDYEAATVAQTYLVEASDLVCKVTVRNKETSAKPLRYFYVRPLHVNGTVSAGSTPNNGGGWGPDYIGPAGPEILAYTGGTYVTFTEGYGIGLWTRGLGHCRRLGQFWNHAAGWWVWKDVAPGQSINFDLKLRCEATADKHVLRAGWYADHRAEFGGLQYDPDHRAVVVWQRFNDPQTDGRLGPYGDHEYPTRGFHEANAAAERGELIGRFAARAGCQGVQLWGGCYYPKWGEWGFVVDGDDVPPAAAAALPGYTDRLDAYGMKNGQLGRIGFVLRYSDGLATQPVRYDQTTWADRDVILSRQQRMISGPLKSRMSYLDDYLSFESDDMGAYVRARVGRGYQYWAELPSDFTWPWAGVYCGTTTQNGVVMLDKQDLVEAMRKVHPQSAVAVTNQSAMSDTEFAVWCADPSRRYSPMFRDHPACYSADWQERADAIRAATEGKLVNQNGGWLWANVPF